MSTPAPPRLLLCAAVLLAVMAAPAAASQVSYDGTTLHYTAGAGESNNLLYTVNPYDTLCAPVAAPCLSISDRARIAFPPGRCVLNSSDTFGDRVYCDLPQEIHTDLGDGDDAMWGWDGRDVIDAGPGNDNPIYGGAGNDVISGGPGGDVLIGGLGDDVTDGGRGDDDFEGIPNAHEGATATSGSDTYVGGGGYDSITYEDRSEDLNLSPDGVADDGAPGEGDNVHRATSRVDATNFPDTITGATAHFEVQAFDGDDVIHGGPAADTLDAGYGNDQVFTGGGADYVMGYYGDDVITSRDGDAAFRIDCGEGDDTVIADPSDPIWPGCETVDVG